jgi:hypothetical protein
MTSEGRSRVGAFYGPLVAEGESLLDGIPVAELERMRDWLDRARELTDRHRDRIQANERQTRNERGRTSPRRRPRSSPRE